MRYVLNSAVVTNPGSYHYKLITSEQAAQWLQDGNWLSTIGYPETALALTTLTGVQVPCARLVVSMEPGDEALVFRLVLPPGTRRIEPGNKGQLGAEYITEHCEIGILRRLGQRPGTVEVPRTGQAALAFSGELVSQVSGKWQFGTECNRWHEISLYRLDNGRFAVSLGYRTQWQGEAPHDIAWRSLSSTEVATTLANYDSGEHVQGYPPYPNYADRQTRLLDNIRRRFKALVSEVLNEAGIVEHDMTGEKT